MMPDVPGHVPVMADEALELLRIHPEGVYVDATAGAGGHAERIASQLRGGRLIALDRDPLAVKMTSARLERYPCAQALRTNYSDMDAALEAQGVAAVDGFLFDLGVSSMQLDSPARGFSFQCDGPLDMRMDTTATMDAARWLRHAERGEIIQVLREYGDVGPAGRIADKIIERRADNRLQTTADLVAAVTDALDFVSSTPVEVRTVFQAVRMAVNEELNHLEHGLRKAAAWLAPQGRIVAITFHSGEDRVVKQVFRSWTRPEVIRAPDGRTLSKRPPLMCAVTPKPWLPKNEETERNPRAKSAKMRAVEKLLSGATP